MDSSKKYKYGILACQMGCGKTAMAYSTVEQAEAEKALLRYPGKSVVDLYTDPSLVKYRTAVMCPGHLVEKWKDELLREVKDAKVHVVTSLKQLTDLADHGPDFDGKEWWIFSKDFAKLGASVMPAVSTIGNLVPEIPVCWDCFESSYRYEYKPGEGGDVCCRRCGGKNWTSVPLHAMPTDPRKKMDAVNAKERQEFLMRSKRYRGMVCPDCGKLLLRNSSKLSLSMDQDGENGVANYILGPEDFATKRSDNTICMHCGCMLWQNDVKTISVGDTDQVPKRKSVCAPDGSVIKNGRRWYKLSYYASKSRKAKKTAWVMAGHEYDFMAANKLTTNDCEISKGTTSVRRYSPAQFIKKHLRGFFTYAILDEAHKYEGQGSAQSVAAHALIKASDFTICLTGTLTNGSAASLFSLLYMLEPGRMKAMGYEWSDSLDFCKKYGSVETVFDYRGDCDQYNSSSRGRQLSQPKVKPGISPAIFGDFLIENTMFLELNDFSNYMPEFSETVDFVPLEPDIGEAYHSLVNKLRDTVTQYEGVKNGMDLLYNSLYYPDRPFDRHPILSGTVADNFTGLGIPIAVPKNLDRYKNGVLLNKEKKLVEHINSELEQGRNVFVFASCTGQEEYKVTNRLKKVIEDNCNLKDRVYILESSSPGAHDRERHIKEKAAAGIKVFITNPKCCETGLDLKFDWEGRSYNYQTIIFYQISFELSVMWQASGRSWRLNQTDPCKVIYLAYEGTAQQEALALMAKKKQAALALQGNLSADSIMGMAAGVDGRSELARSIMANSSSASANELSDMFDVINNNRLGADDGAYSGYEPPKTWHELIGSEGKGNDFLYDDLDDLTAILEKGSESSEAKVVEKVAAAASVTMIEEIQSFETKVASPADGKTSEKTTTNVVEVQFKSKRKTKAQKHVAVGQLDFSSLLFA